MFYPFTSPFEPLNGFFYCEPSYLALGQMHLLIPVPGLNRRSFASMFDGKQVALPKIWFIVAIYLWQI